MIKQVRQVVDSYHGPLNIVLAFGFIEEIGNGEVLPELNDAFLFQSNWELKTHSQWKLYSEVILSNTMSDIIPKVENGGSKLTSLQPLELLSTAPTFQVTHSGMKMHHIQIEPRLSVLQVVGLDRDLSE